MSLASSPAIWAIGDIQGCCRPLDSLLSHPDVASDSQATFWFAGDLVNRGPDSLGALRLDSSLGQAELAGDYHPARNFHADLRGGLRLPASIAALPLGHSRPALTGLSGSPSIRVVTSSLVPAMPSAPLLSRTTTCGKPFGPLMKLP